MNSQKGFEKKTPSLFIVGSPFQILCMVEAIHVFEIETFKILVPFSSAEGRTNQMKSMLEYYHFDYELVDESLVRAKALLLGKKKFECEFDRVFVGNYNLLLYKALAFSCVKKGGSIVYLDDGAATIPILQGKVKKDSWQCRILNKFLGLRFFANSVNYNSLFFTVYSDVKTKKSVYPNGLRSLIPAKTMKLKKEIIFIGTNSTVFAEVNRISFAQYKENVKRIICKLRADNPDYSMIYIPHGRDDNNQIREICEQNGVQYQKINEAVELYLIKRDGSPEIVGGLLSSALLNIKKMVPAIKVKNYFFMDEKNPEYRKYLGICDYYSKNGIEIIDSIE